MNKGVSATLWIVVTAIVVFIVAMVILSMVSGPIGSVASITDARNICKTICQTSLLCIGKKNDEQVPYWGNPSVMVGDSRQYCKHLVETCKDCRA